MTVCWESQPQGGQHFRAAVGHEIPDPTLGLRHGIDIRRRSSLSRAPRSSLREHSRKCGELFAERHRHRSHSGQSRVGDHLCSRRGTRPSLPVGSDNLWRRVGPLVGGAQGRDRSCRRALAGPLRLSRPALDSGVSRARVVGSGGSRCRAPDIGTPSAVARVNGASDRSRNIAGRRRRVRLFQALSGGLGSAVALGFELFELFRHGRVDDRREIGGVTGGSHERLEPLELVAKLGTGRKGDLEARRR